MSKSNWVLALAVVLALVPACGKPHQATTGDEEGPSEQLASPSGDRGEPRTGLAPATWWQPQYQELIARIGREAGGVLRYEYRTGPRGEEVMRVALRRTEGGGLAVDLDMPPGALVKVDEDTGRSSRVARRVHMTLRDDDGDGVVDAVQPPEGTVVNGSRRRADGLMRVDVSDDEESFHALWNLHVGVAVNHVIHRRESASPPR